MRVTLVMILAFAGGCGTAGVDIPDAPSVAPTADAYLTLDNPARRGAAMTAVLVTTPGSRCEISVNYPGAPPPSDLIPKTVPAGGQLQWIWTVAQTTPPGRYPIPVTCTQPSGRRATVRSTLEVP